MTPIGSGLLLLREMPPRQYDEGIPRPFLRILTPSSAARARPSTAATTRYRHAPQGARVVSASVDRGAVEEFSGPY
jgi:hypothetical protein